MSDSERELIEKLLSALADAPKVPEKMKWVKDIADPSTDLIKSLTQCFVTSLDDPKFCNSIIKALRLLYDTIPEIVLPQLESNKEFPNALTEYLIQIDKNDQEGDAYILLINLFEKCAFSEYSSKEFKKSMFDSLAIIQDEQIFESIVRLILTISSQESCGTIIHYCCNHKNRRFFTEYLIHIVNKEDKKALILALEFIRSFHEKKGSLSELFATNDLRIFIDIGIRIISNSADPDVKTWILYIFVVLSCCPDYRKDAYRKSDLIEIATELEEEESNPTVIEYSKSLKSNLDAL